MRTLRVHIENGRLAGEAPSWLPEGDVELQVSEPEDEFSEDELAQLDVALAAGLAAASAKEAARQRAAMLDLPDAL